MIKIIDCCNQSASSFLERPFSENSDVRNVVEDIISAVSSGGDRAIDELTKKIEKIDLSGNFEVSNEEFEQAEKAISQELKSAIAVAQRNIQQFHSLQQHKEVILDRGDGVVCVQRSRAISRVGLYIPGGTAPLFSTVLMLALPAKIAGCKEIILCTPPSKEGKVAAEILYCAKVCGVDKVYKIGGATAIAAMAYGTESIKPCYKLFGPGNRYVTTAKQLVSTDRCAIDMPAGPSEVMVVCDESSSPRFVAADLLSQAEHGVDSQAIAVVLSQEMANKIKYATEQMVQELARKDFASLSLKNSSIIVVKDKRAMLDVINEYAPEHLIISTQDAEEFALEVDNAGSIFIGHYTPESAGDYCSGTNHTLPTSGWAKSMSGVNLDSFCKKITYQSISKKGIEMLAPSIIAMADAEGLTAHSLAAKVRIEESASTTENSSKSESNNSNNSEIFASTSTIKASMRANIQNLAPYSTARDEYQGGEIGTFLDANESPFNTGLNRYPDPHLKLIRQRLSTIKGVDSDQIFVGNGSDEAIDLIFRVFCTPSRDNIVAISPSYGMYKVAAEINDIEVKDVLLEDDFSISSEKILSATNYATKAIFLCSPNNPSANLLCRDEIEKILSKFQGVVVVDEAYVDFCPSYSSFITDLSKYPNLIVLQTLSKAWGLAGVRFGMGFASKEIIEIMNRVKYPYNINTLTQELVYNKLLESERVKDECLQIISERKLLSEELAKLVGIRKIYPSDANFILIKVDNANLLYNYLVENRVIVRNRNSVVLCSGCLRITIGTKEENVQLLNLLKNYEW